MCVFHSQESYVHVNVSCTFYVVTQKQTFNSFVNIETERPLVKLLKDHRTPVSPVSEHMTAESHRLNLEHVEDVAVRSHETMETDWFRRGVAKAICIATDRPTLNQDRGRHTLPTIYSQLVSSRDTSDLSDNQESRDDTEASVR